MGSWALRVGGRRLPRKPNTCFIERFLLYLVRSPAALATRCRTPQLGSRNGVSTPAPHMGTYRRRNGRDNIYPVDDGRQTSCRGHAAGGDAALPRLIFPQKCGPHSALQRNRQPYGSACTRREWQYAHLAALLTIRRLRD